MEGEIARKSHTHNICKVPLVQLGTFANDCVCQLKWWEEVSVWIVIAPTSGFISKGIRNGKV